MPLIETEFLGDGWAYEVFTPDTAPSEFGPAASFVELWNSKRAGTALPAWKDFQIEEFGPWYGWLALEELLPAEGYESLFRLWGNRLVDSFDIELTNTRFSDAVCKVYSPDEVRFWLWLSRTHFIARATGTMDWLEHFHRLHGRSYIDITLPLADDGTTVDRYLTVTVVIAPGAAGDERHSVFGAKPQPGT
ncbi:MAG: hypothetical protein RIC16_09320 [Rhodospirillales bacterium]